MGRVWLGLGWGEGECPTTDGGLFGGETPIVAPFD